MGRDPGRSAQTLVPAALPRATPSGRSPLMRASIGARRFLTLSPEPAVDLGNDQIAVTRFWPTPTRENEALALTNALCQRRGRSRHLAVVSQIVLKLRAITLDDLGARSGIAMIAEHDWVSENGIAAMISTAVSPAPGFPGAPARSHGDVRVKSQIQWRIGKTPEAVSVPRFEPASVTWSSPHQIKLTFGRRAKRLHQYPACGGWGSGGRDHSCCRLFKPYAPSIRPPRSAETDRVSVDCVNLLRSSMRRPSLQRLR